MRNQKTLVVDNGTTTNKKKIIYVRLLQELPLSPILYLFFNANFVYSVFNKNKGFIAFIDDYTAWVTSPKIITYVEKL